MRDDTAFMDRIHAYAPGWDYPKLNHNDHLTDHFGLVSDFLSECWNRLRIGNRVSVIHERVYLGGALSGRDRTSSAAGPAAYDSRLLEPCEASTSRLPTITMLPSARMFSFPRLN